MQKTSTLQINRMVKSFAISFMVLLSILIIAKTNAYAAKAIQTQQDSTNDPSLSSGNSVTVSEVIKAQNAWAKGIVAIGKAYTEHKDYNQVAINLINQLYAYNYENGIVLFKPTKAQEVPFRKTKEAALSYFVGDNVAYSEDKGFAIQPWTNVVFHNDEMYFHGDMAIAMGSYDFTDSNDKVARVEYTFAYVKDDKGQLKIVLHHSSMPYNNS
ncbi:hypothetical protein L3V82_10620 [Thiotrichales bacterium 19S3-7]|nr:hypothetical protein [Thiotrichales bacterium 19S3-7]MCF6802610.1 hypothetical protein [Thiotrichales bacterium 19S3-11]